MCFGASCFTDRVAFSMLFLIVRATEFMLIMQEEPGAQAELMLVMQESS